jgi:hypothetical protein
MAKEAGMNDLVWKGAARPLDPSELDGIAEEIDVPAAALRALIAVEASGRWYLSDGSLPRRFEPHHLPAAVQRAIGWGGGWRDSLALAVRRREALFRAALAADQAATLSATSWGAPQIMGMHAKRLGYGSVQAMVGHFAASAHAQVLGLARFIDAHGLASAMRAQDWPTVARVYNGSGQADVYARKLEAAWRRETGQRSAEVLRVGSAGPSVRDLQAQIGLPVDGSFGPETGAAVRDYQRKAGLPQDGIVGARTWASLRDRAPASAPMPEPRAQASSGDALMRGVAKASAAVGVTATAVTQISGAAGEVLDRLSPGVQEGVIVGALILSAVAAAGWIFSQRRKAST